MIQNCLNSANDQDRKKVVVAVRLMTGELSQVGSLCELSEVNFGSSSEYVRVDLKCTGQVKLLEQQEEYNESHFAFEAEHVDVTFEDQDELDQAVAQLHPIGATPEVELDAETKKRLEALGYF